MGGLPLSKLRIVELANVVAGPSVGKHLSDFGAEVIKVERPGDGDTARAMGEFVGNRDRPGGSRSAATSARSRST